VKFSSIKNCNEKKSRLVLSGRRHFLFIGLCLFGINQSALAESVTLQWSPATADTRVTGYEVHYGTASNKYQSTLLANVNGANTSTQVVSGLTAGYKYYFAVRSRGQTASDVSAFSNEVNTTVSASDTVKPTTPGNLSATVAGTSQLNLSWSASTDNMGVSGYQLERCQGAACSAFAQITTANSTSYANSGLSPATSYSYRVRAIDTSGLTSSYSTIVTATTLATAVSPSPSPSPSSCSGNTIWDSTAKPASAAVSESPSVELGVKFKSDSSGYICGVRFYKGSTNTGTHIGRLWKSDGTLLSQATFANETGSGWQQVNFSSPVAITAGTVYVASYLAPKGNFAVTRSQFSRNGVDKAPLHALKNGVNGGNGVYRYGSGGFPTDSYSSSNYWVDVVFTTKNTGAIASSLMSSSSQITAESSVSFSDEIPFEVGEVDIDNKWLWVDLRQNFTDPVVVANVPTENNLDLALVRIDGVESRGFWIRMQNRDETNGVNVKETVGYLVMERGQYQLNNGTWVEAGRLETNKTSGFERVIFEAPFIDAPVVLSAISTVNGQDGLNTQVRKIDINGFDIGLRMSDKKSRRHTVESIDYIAWEVSSGDINGMRFDVARQKQSVNDTLYTIDYPGDFVSAPVFLANIQSSNDSELASMRLEAKNTGALDLRVEYEQSHRNESSNSDQSIGYLLIYK
jgi:hypothetical protein